MMIDPTISSCHAAYDADLALNFRPYDPTDAEAEVCDVRILDAYRTVPTSLAGIVALAELALAVEDLDPAVIGLIESIRAGAIGLST